MNSDEDHSHDYPGGGSFLPRNKTSPYDLNSKIMLTAIISLSIVITLVTALHIYARYVLRRQARQRAALRGLGLGLTGRRAQSSQQEPKRGLDPMVIASIPIFMFKQTDGQDSTECAVCLNILEDEEMARLLPNCNHTFHAECIDKWLSSNPTCPICRTEAEPLPQLQPKPEPREGPVGRGGTAAAASAPLLERVALLSPAEGASSAAAADSGAQSCAKVSCPNSTRLSSFRRMLSGRERSSRRIQSSGQEDGIQDLEMQ